MERSQNDTESSMNAGLDRGEARQEKQLSDYYTLGIEIRKV